MADGSGHPEIASAPWALWGHSGGAYWSLRMACLFPDRTVAVVARSNGLKEHAAELPTSVPVIFIYGVREKEEFKGIVDSINETFPASRARGALAAMAVDPESSHDCRHSRLLAIPYLDACLSMRLGPDGLRNVDPASGVFTGTAGGDVREYDPQLQDDESMSWLPDARVAKALAEYVSTGRVTDTTPPDHAPTELAAHANGDGSVEPTWKARADVDSGIKTFNVYRDGELLGSYAGDAAYHDGAFQSGNYGDDPLPDALYQSNSDYTWEPPAMRFVDRGLTPGETYSYAVSTVNWSDLESARSAPLTYAHA